MLGVLHRWDQAADWLPDEQNQWFVVIDEAQNPVLQLHSPDSLVSPEPSVLGSGSSRYDFGDEDARVFTDVRVVCAARDAEAQSRVTLDNQDSHHDDHNKNKQ